MEIFTKLYRNLKVNIGYHEPMLELMGRLRPLMPSPQLDTFFFWNSGAEAVEAAVKLARYATGRPNIITLQGIFCFIIDMRGFN